MSSVAHFYRWLFYRCYVYSLTVDGNYRIKTLLGGNAGIAAIYMTTFLFLNALTLDSLRVFMFGHTPGMLVLFGKDASYWVIRGAMLALLALHLGFLAHKKRYRKIISEFSKENEAQARRGERLFNSYSITTVLLFLGSFLFLFARLPNPDA